jgi:hypothetical protein
MVCAGALSKMITSKRYGNVPGSLRTRHCCPSGSGSARVSLPPPHPVLRLATAG